MNKHLYQSNQFIASLAFQSKARYAEMVIPFYVNTTQVWDVVRFPKGS